MRKKIDNGQLTMDNSELSKGWEMKKLGDVCDFQNGFAFKSKTFKDDGIPIVRITNIQNGKLDLSKVVYIDPNDYDKDLSKYKIIKGDLLIAMSGATTGKIGIHKTNKVLLLNQRVGKFNPKSVLNKSFLFDFLETKVEESLAISAGAAQPNLSTEQIKNFQIPLPPLPEQKRIVSILDRAFEAIDKAKANTEQNLKNAKELFESYLQGVFENKGDDWINSTIGKTCNLITGGTPSRSKSEYFKNGTINWLVSGDINKKAINECDGKITELGLKNSNAKFLPLNSVMIALNGQGKTRGTVAMLKIKATCNQSLVSIYPKDDNEVLPELIFSNLQGRYNEIRKITGDSGNDRRGLNMPLIRKIKFSYPKSIAKQQQIVRKLDTLSTETKKLESIYQQKINDLEELKKSILQKAFAGELTDKEIAI